LIATAVVLWQKRRHRTSFAAREDFSADGA
jgi:hypothetical protein